MDSAAKKKIMEKNDKYNKEKDKECRRLCKIRKIFIKRREKKDEIKFLENFYDPLCKIIHYYHEYGVIDQSILKCIDEVSYDMRQTLQFIYDIIQSPNMNEKIDEFIKTNPNRMLLRFLSLCSMVKENGDETLRNGNSMFIEYANILKADIYDELIILKNNR